MAVLRVYHPLDKIAYCINGFLRRLSVVGACERAAMWRDTVYRKRILRALTENRH